LRSTSGTGSGSSSSSSSSSNAIHSSSSSGVSGPSQLLRLSVTGDQAGHGEVSEAWPEWVAAVKQLTALQVRTRSSSSADMSAYVCVCKCRRCSGWCALLDSQCIVGLSSSSMQAVYSELTSVHCLLGFVAPCRFWTWRCLRVQSAPCR
jgi:hypothetical protein